MKVNRERILDAMAIWSENAKIVQLVKGVIWKKHVPGLFWEIADSRYKARQAHYEPKIAYTEELSEDIWSKRRKM